MAPKRTRRKAKRKPPGQVKRAPKLTADQVAAVAAEVNRRRTEAGLTLRQVADRAGVHTSAVGAIEKGRTTPAVGTLAALAGALGCQVRDLVANLVTPAKKSES